MFQGQIPNDFSPMNYILGGCMFAIGTKILAVEAKKWQGYFEFNQLNKEKIKLKDIATRFHLDNSQKETRNISSDLFKVKAAYEDDA